MGTAAIIFISVITGIILGILYFGGLWYTVDHFIGSRKHSPLFVLFSFLLRTATAVAGFYMLLKLTGEWQSLAIALAGFVISRIIISRLVNKKVHQLETKY